jgi:hypothetical protein
MKLRGRLRLAADADAHALRVLNLDALFVAARFPIVQANLGHRSGNNLNRHFQEPWKYPVENCPTAKIKRITQFENPRQFPIFEFQRIGFVQGAMAKISNSAGIPLSAAWRQLASRKLKNALRDAENFSPPVVQLNDPEAPSNFLGRAVEFFGEFAKNQSSKSSTVFKMRRDLQRSLIAGKYSAFGYRTKPKIQKTIDHIPGYVFQGEIDWDRSLVTNDDQKFEGVEIRAAHNRNRRASIASDQYPEIPPSFYVEHTRPGPKSLGPIVRDIYEQMEARGDFSKCETQKARWNLIIAEINKNSKYKNIRGLSYPSFCRHLKSRND